MDVWFDSGSSWAAVAEQRDELRYPADLYLEGSDQHRGWFQSSLLTSVAVNGVAPYKQVLTHGFVLDEKGYKMSKSLGNVVDPLLVINGGKDLKKQPGYGADVLRLWVASVNYASDVCIGDSIIKQCFDTYRKLRNTARYLLGNLHDFDPSQDAIPYEELPLLDQWMLQRTASLIDSVSGDFERFEFYRFFQALQNFCVVDLSNVYLDIAKDRLYVSGANDFRRRSCQTVLALVVERLAGLIAPVLCHMAEDIWQNLPYSVAETSVFERGWPSAPEQWRQSALEQPMNQILELRALVNRQLESCRSAAQLGASLEAQVQLSLGEGSKATQAALSWLENSVHPKVDNLADWLLVSDLEIGSASPEAVLAEASENGITVQIRKAAGQKCERCWHYESDIGEHAAHPTLCGRCVEVLA